MATSNGRILPTERAWFTGQQGRIDRAYDLGRQQNRYDRNLATRQYGWDRTDLLKRLAQSRAQIPGTFQRRGLATSGIAQRGLVDFNDERSTALARLAEANGLKTSGYDMVDNQLKRVRDDSTTDLTRQIEALRQLRAEALRPYMT